MNVNTNQIGSVILAVLMLSSVGLAPVGTVAAQDDTTEDTTIGDRLDQCVSETSQNVSLLDYALTGGASVAYHCIGGAWSADQVADYNNAELVDQGWVTSTSMVDSAAQREDEFSTWGSTSVTYALQEAEKPIVEAHYNEEDKAVSKADGNEVVRDYFAQQQAKEHKQNTEIIERFVSVSKNTNTADNVDPMATFYTDAYQQGATYSAAGSDANIVYEQTELKNGETMETVQAVTGIEGIQQPDGDSDSTGTDFILVVSDSYTTESGTTLSGPALHSSSDGGSTWGSEGSPEMRLHDPYNDGDTLTVGSDSSYISEHDSRVSQINTYSDDALSQAQTMVDDLYANHEKGTINPEEYVSSATLVNEYNSENSHYSYATATAASLGFKTDVQSSQIIEVGGEEYEGTILVDGDESGLDPLASTTADTVSDASNSYFSFSEEQTSQTVTFDSGTVTSVTGATSDGVSIDGGSVTVNQSSLTGDWVVYEVETTDSNDNTVTTRYIMYSDAETADEYSNIPSGLVAGNTYNPSNFGTVMLSYQSGDTADTMAVESEFTVNELRNAETGEEVAVVEYADGVDRDFTDTTNLTEKWQQNEDLDNKFNQRSDVDPAGSGGSLGSLEAGVIGAIGGIGLVLGFGVIVVILFLVGRITSVA
jgi:protein tyrosine phosphatase (PTP) superfamily phosphohydrolase (DUF442 family)